MNKICKKTSIIILVLSISSFLFSNSFFSGMTGVNLNYSGSTETNEDNIETYNPDLKLQAFFAGQFNFSDKLWARTEFSINTADFLDENIFNNGTSTNFRIEEISLVIKGELLSATNYFSTFIGTYEQIGSDIFLQKYFGIEPIASKLTTSYLGLSGSNIHKQSGFGIGDVLLLKNTPMAFGLYSYINSDSLNKDNSNIFVFNADLRFATSLQYFTLDILGGIGIPLENTTDDYLIAVQTAYWHAGTNILIGNNYTQSVFLQLGIFNAAFNKTELNLLEETLYFLLEPRFNFKNCNLDITLYNIPNKNYNDSSNLPFLDGSLGGNINLYVDSVKLGSSFFTLGLNTNISYSNADILSCLGENGTEYTQETFTEQNFNISLAAYASTQFLSGELSCIIKMNFMELSRNNPGKVFSADIGYKTKI